MINKHLKRIITTILIILILLNSSALAATIITGEQSKDNDEYDQQLTVDATNKDAMTMIESTTQENGGLLDVEINSEFDYSNVQDLFVSEQTKEEQEAAYDIRTKIEKELEKQLKEDMASSAKYQIDYVIYYSEYDVEEGIRKAWKESKNKDISDENLQKIMNVAKNTLTEYGYAKIDLWFDQYYTNNKSIIVEKVIEYVDEDESYISSGVSIVVYTAVSKIEDEVEKVAQEAMDEIPTTARTVADSLKNVSSWEAKAISTLCSQITIDIKNKLEKAFSTEFEWQEEQTHQAFRDIGSFSSDVADQFTDEVTNYLSNSLNNYLGYYSSLAMKDKLLQFALNQIDGSLGQQYELLNRVVEGNISSPAELQQYYNEYQSILNNKNNVAKNQYEQMLKEANKQATDSLKKQKEGEANDWYQNRLKEIEKETSAEAREKLKNEALNQYKAKVDEIDTQVKTEAADMLNKEANDLVNGIIKEANAQYKDFDYASVMMKQKESELDKQEDAEKKKLDQEYGLELSDEKKAMQNQEKIDEKTRHEQADTKIDIEYGQEITEAQKNAKKTEETAEKEIHEQIKENLAIAAGQKLTPEEETKKNNEIDEATSDYIVKVNELDKQYDQYISDTDKTSKKTEEQDAEKAYNAEVDKIKAEYGQQELNEKEKAQKETLLKAEDELHEQRDKDIDIQYGRELSDAKKQEKNKKLNEEDELHEKNDQAIDVKYGRELSPELKLEKENLIKQCNINYDIQWKELQSKYDFNSSSQHAAYVRELHALIDKNNAEIEAIANNAKYKLNPKQEIDGVTYTQAKNNEDVRHQTAEAGIESQYKLTKVEQINGVTYEQAKNKEDEKHTSAKELIESSYSKKELSDTDKAAYELEIKKAEQEYEDKLKEIDQKYDKQADLNDEKREEYEKAQAKLEEELKEKLETIDKKYQPSGAGNSELEEAYKALLDKEEERHEAKMAEIEKTYGKRDLNPSEQEAYEKAKNAEDAKYKENMDTIKSRYATKDKDDLSDTDKATYEQRKKKIEEDYKKQKEAEEARIKAAKEEYKQKLQNAEETYELGIKVCDEKYELDKAQLDEQYKTGKITKEKYETDKKELKKKYETEKQALIAQKQQILDQERREWATEKQAAYEITKQFVTFLASDFTNDLMLDLTDSIYDWAQDLGGVGAGLVTGVTNQIAGWARTEIVKNIGVLWDQVWGTTASSLGIQSFKLDWKQLALSVVFSWAMQNEFLAEVLSGVGGYLPPKAPMLYESLAVLNWGLISRAFVTLVPNGSEMTARKIAEKYADQSLEIGDRGKWRDDPFGTNEVLGYNPLQFFQTGSSTLVALIEPFLFIDTVKMQKGSHAVHPVWLPFPPLPTWFAMNVTGGKISPGRVMKSYPWIGPYFDSAYVLSEFGSNFGNDSYVQRAYSYTSMSLKTASSSVSAMETVQDYGESNVSGTSTGGYDANFSAQLAFEPTVYSTALVKEAMKYAEFAAKVTLALGYPNSLKDLTDQNTLKTRYLSEQDIVLIGPFKVDYILSGVQTEFRTTNFGMMVNMNVYYRDDATQEEKQLSKDNWSIFFEENGDIDFAFSEDRQGSDYIYPYPKEEFYIAINKSANPDVTNISKIRMDFKELQTTCFVHTFDLFYDVIWSKSKMKLRKNGPHWSDWTWEKDVLRSVTNKVVVDDALIAIMYAKRAYMNWHMEISVEAKPQTQPAYETADYYTTQYQTVATVGGGQTDRENVLYGDETNSSLYNSLNSLLNVYNKENMNKYNLSGATFVDSVKDATTIYIEAHGDTEYTNAINAILKATAENDATKVLTTFEKITTEDNDDFQKIAIMAQELSKKEKVRELATIIDTAVEIYKNINDNVGREILNLLNETAILYNDADYDAIMDSINTIINNCDYKEEVFALLAQKNDLNLTNEAMDNYLKINYPRLDEDKRALIMSTSKSILSVINNTGDKGNVIAQIIEKAFKVHKVQVVMSELIGVIVDNSNNEELQKEYRTIVSIMQINNEVAVINASEALTDAEKYKYAQEEQVKMYKAISIVAKTINDGEDVINAIEKAYGETTNIEKNVFTKFQDLVKDLEQDDLNSMTKSLQKSTSIETTLDIVNTEYLRNNLKGETEKAQTFTEILEERAALYDTTPYTQYDRNYNILTRDDAEDVYYMDSRPTGWTISIGGVVWKDGHTGLQNDYDGVRKANTNGDLEAGIEGVQVTLIQAETNKVGRMKVNGVWQPAITYTDEGGYYHFEMVEAITGHYYVQFTYDGHKYMATTSLSDGEKRTSVDDYTYIPDLELYDNNSKAAEDPEERQAFNNKFYEIRQNAAYSKDGEMLNVDGKNVLLEYVEKDGVAELVTLDSAGHVLPQFAMTASTKELVGAKYGLAQAGLTYPIDTNITLDNEKTEALLSQYLDANPQYGEYEKTGEYMYHVNLGLVERTKIDLATTQDVYEVTTTVNEKQETYSYNQRGVLSIFDAKLKQTSAYSDIAYTRELYNADYQLRLEDYQANSLNKLDRNGNDKTEEIEKIKEIKTLEYNKGGLEQRVFVTYKITLKNQAMLQSARINEIIDYFDPSYKLVTEDTYQEIQNAEGIVENKLVAKQSYFIVQADNSATEYKLNWEETGMVNGLKSMYTLQSESIGLEDIMLSAKDEIYVFVTFELDKTSMDTTNRTLPLGKKQNIVEISSYSTFEIGSEDWSNSIGLIDKDSAPDNLSVGEINSYEDDTDAAPIIDFKLYSTDLRNVNGYVWNDDRDVKLSTGQVVGNGVREEKEELINGVRVQLVEIVRDPQTGAEYEYVWKEMFTGEDNYKHIGSSGSITNTERGQTVSTGSIISNTNLGAVQKGEYKFHNYIAGNFVIRFIYGDTYKTYLTAGSENAEGQGLNEASFNGHDYKSTAYLKGNNLYAEWYDLSGFDKEDKLYSDAKDDTTRRNVVIDYAATLQNDKAEILASFDDRGEKYYYGRQLHQTFRDNTWMFADTAKINVNVEYNTTKSNGLDALNYRLKNMDFGLEKRPETKLELTKEITDIKITLASGEVIVNTAAGMSQNVNWPRNQKTAIINNGKKSTYNKRDSLRYEYRQGNAHIYMDEEVMQGTNIQFTYKITVTNNSEIDYTGQNGNLGYAYYTGQVSASDRIVTTTVNKIIDYVDNSLTFRKVDSPEWDLIENMREFTTTSSGAQIEKEVMDYGTYIETMMNRYGEDYVAEHLREFEAQYQIYTQTGSLEDIGNKKPNTEDENEKGVGLSNYNVLKNMKDRTNSIGYLNEDLAIVKTKSAKVSQEPITQVIVTKALENTALKPGETASVQLILSKTLSPNDEDDTLNYGNMAEILQYSNSVGRRDMDAIPGNQQPDEDPYEYDTDFTERILITPPYGENKAIYFVLSIAVLAILTGGIILIKKKVFNN